MDNGSPRGQWTLNPWAKPEDEGAYWLIWDRIFLDIVTLKGDRYEGKNNRNTPISGTRRPGP